MGRRSLLVAHVVEVLEHWTAGRPLRAIAESLGLDRNTVRKYITPAPRGWLRPEYGATAGGVDGVRRARLSAAGHRQKKGRSVEGVGRTPCRDRRTAEGQSPEHRLAADA